MKYTASAIPRIAKDERGTEEGDRFNDPRSGLVAVRMKPLQDRDIESRERRVIEDVLRKRAEQP